jgi:hypothetical protein
MDVSNGSFKDNKAIFEFSSKNSTNEFSYQSYANGNSFISTSFLPGVDVSATLLIERNGKLLHHVHSHPGEYSLSPSTGDVDSARILKLVKKYGTRFELYSPLTGKYKGYNENSSSYTTFEIFVKSKKKNKN